jgi:hypothetical protein
MSETVTCWKATKSCDSRDKYGMEKGEEELSGTCDSNTLHVCLWGDAGGCTLWCCIGKAVLASLLCCVRMAIWELVC